MHASDSSPLRLGYTGTSGWSNAAWKPEFYPATSRSAHWLEYYASQLSAIELNASFYRAPTPGSIAKWVDGTPAPFRFAVKMWQGITHEARLRDCEEQLFLCLKHYALFGEKRGPILFQLPPSLVYDAVLLKDFLALLPPNTQAVFEFRHASWQRDETYQLLADAQASLCLSHMKKWTSPHLLTAPIAYVRLHGPQQWFKGEYDAPFIAELGQWLNDSGAHTAYVFFNNTMTPAAPRNAQSMQLLLPQPYYPARGDLFSFAQ